MCAGSAKWCLKIAREWSSERVQWGKPIGEHEAVAGKIAFIAATTYAIEAMVELAGEMADEGSTDIRIEAALAKLYGSEMGWLIADELVQIRGGRGFETAESLAARGERGVPAEQVLRDMRINRIFEGSTEIMHLLIAREAVDAHLSVAGDLIDPSADKARKARAAANAGKFYARWLPTLVAGKGQLPTAYAEFGPLATHLRFVERASRRLARATFYAMSRWQGRLEHKQRFLARIVDIGAELFAMSAVCVRAQRDQHEGTAVELADAFCRQARVRVDDSVRPPLAQLRRLGPAPCPRRAGRPVHLAGGRRARPVDRGPLDRPAGQDRRSTGERAPTDQLTSRRNRWPRYFLPQMPDLPGQ